MFCSWVEYCYSGEGEGVMSYALMAKYTANRVVRLVGRDGYYTVKVGDLNPKKRYQLAVGIIRPEDVSLKYVSKQMRVTIEKMQCSAVFVYEGKRYLMVMGV